MAERDCATALATSVFATPGTTRGVTLPPDRSARYRIRSTCRFRGPERRPCRTCYDRSRNPSLTPRPSARSLPNARPTRAHRLPCGLGRHDCVRHPAIRAVLAPAGPHRSRLRRGRQRRPVGNSSAACVVSARARRPRCACRGGAERPARASTYGAPRAGVARFRRLRSPSAAAGDHPDARRQGEPESRASPGSGGAHQYRLPFHSRGSPSETLRARASVYLPARDRDAACCLASSGASGSDSADVVRQPIDLAIGRRACRAARMPWRGPAL